MKSILLSLFLLTSPVMAGECPTNSSTVTEVLDIAQTNKVPLIEHLKGLEEGAFIKAVSSIIKAEPPAASDEILVFHLQELFLGAVFFQNCTVFQIPMSPMTYTLASNISKVNQ